MRAKNTLIVAALCALGGALAAQQPPPPALRVLVPAYFYPVPGSPWSRLNAMASAHPGRIHAIGNPASGPGGAIDPNYSATFNAFRASGGKLLGYVDSNYGQRPLGAVRADIVKWFAFYPLDGIFVDQMDNVPGGHERYYAWIHGFVKRHLPQAIVVANPGVSTTPSYLQLGATTIASALCIHENSTNFLQWSADPWVASFPRERFYALPYAVGASGWHACVDHAFAENVGWFFTTNDVLPNPWDTLPPYFETMVGYVAANY